MGISYIRLEIIIVDSDNKIPCTGIAIFQKALDNLIGILIIDIYWQQCVRLLCQGCIWLWIKTYFVAGIVCVLQLTVLARRSGWVNVLVHWFWSSLLLQPPIMWQHQAGSCVDARWLHSTVISYRTRTTVTTLGWKQNIFVLIFSSKRKSLLSKMPSATY